MNLSLLCRISQQHVTLTVALIPRYMGSVMANARSITKKARPQVLWRMRRPPSKRQVGADCRRGQHEKRLMDIF